LDLACGTGELEGRLVSLFPRIKIVALDNSPHMLSQAGGKLKGTTQVSFVQGDVNGPLPFAEASFDYVVFANALHYVARPGLLLVEIHRVIKPGRQLIMEDFTVHRYLLWTWFEKLLRVFDPQHYRTYSLSELCRFVATAGFTHLNGECFRINW
jgi:ubiquinone/menaquinone biosynthesis C-methylase UbiE